jgi:hypothetical protein
MKKIFSWIKLPTNIKQNLIEYGTATLLIAVVVWFVINKNVNQNNDELKQKIESTNQAVDHIESKIDSIKQYQELLYVRTWELEKAQDETLRMIDRGNSLLIQNKISLEKIRFDYNEKINGAGSYNYNQLDSFFTDRYR